MEVTWTVTIEAIALEDGNNEATAEGNDVSG